MAKSSLYGESLVKVAKQKNPIFREAAFEKSLQSCYPNFKFDEPVNQNLIIFFAYSIYNFYESFNKFSRFISG